jgi:hypothetical protein
MGRGAGGRLGAAISSMGVAAWGEGLQEGGLSVAASLCAAVRACLLFVRERRPKEKGEEKEKEGKENRKKKKIWRIF